MPDNVKKLRGFLGLAGYYRKFVRNFGVISKPVTDLLLKGVVFFWTPITDAAFNALKNALMEAPVLSLPDFKKGSSWKRMQVPRALVRSSCRISIPLLI